MIRASRLRRVRAPLPRDAALPKDRPDATVPAPARFAPRRAALTAILLCLAGSIATSPLATASGSEASTAPATEPIPIVVYVARKIVTMEPGQPEATAVAVRGKEILDVGSLKDFAPWLADLPHQIDRRFAKKVLLPGFIDPQVHPFLAAKLLTFDIAAPEEWVLPDETVPATTTREAFVARLAKLSEAWPHRNRPHIVWGWHRLWHGDFTRADLDRISPNKALLIWHRSYHEIVANSRALEWMNIDPALAPNSATKSDLDKAISRKAEWRPQTEVSRASRSRKRRSLKDFQSSRAWWPAAV